MTNNARLSLLLSAVVAGVFAFVGGWQRRWMSDDGLIVLRTVRNLVAGNGPVFNVGERVEANTSTLWQYLITAVAFVSDARLENIAMWLALLLTTVAAVTATWASGRFWNRRAGAVAVLPLGVIVYFALPPARDFATSGLEWGLSICWLAVWWALLVVWAQPSGRRALPAAGYWLAFWCGLSWLVRPEFALYGGVTGIVLLTYSPRKTLGILAAALPVPAAYQIFRMGYYGLITPHTAVAKSAADSEWAQGAGYLWDFLGPYALWAPLAVAIAVGVWLMADARGRELAIVIIVVGCAAFHVLYILRVGGDFMHGRMLLLPLFAMLLPLMAVPARPVTIGVLVAAVVWAGVIIVRAHPLPDDLRERDANTLGIVDEREFWTMAAGRQPGDPPRYSEDFLTTKLMGDWGIAVEEGRAADAAQLSLARLQRNPEKYAWYYRVRFDAQSDLHNQPLTAYLINLGMTGMNAELDMRVLDTVGLATPLAARMPRDPAGRIGHDKYLEPEWQAADTAVDLDTLPEWIDIEKAKQARAALRTPEIAELLASSRAPLTRERFIANLRFALGPGRTLELNNDPSVYLDQATLRRIESGEDVGRSGERIAWPRSNSHGG
ncbi:hypothetical protein [Corynebacterium sp.]|uniref:hypothetical protein n=1 Tax=Corynebacterium sp. TaxID=1720 RepID=UPI002A90F7AF|nr:hypothetical protein [Corynebacterium sp.]MDY5785065.1 hypothetical protein [Corynebacterium sp.]